MLRSIFLKTLRDLRGQILVWCLALGIPSAAVIVSEWPGAMRMTSPLLAVY